MKGATCRTLALFAAFDSERPGGAGAWNEQRFTRSRTTAVPVSEGSRWSIRRMKELGNARVRTLTLDDARAGQRVDNFLLRELKGVPRSHV